MKKLLSIVLLFIVINTNGYSQDSTKLTAEKIYADVKEGFTALVNNLEGPAKHVYGVYVKQQKVEGWSSLICALFTFSLGLIIIIRNWGEADFEEGNKYAALSIVGILVTAIGLALVWIFLGGSGYTQITNPEYHAIKDIIDTFK